MSLQGLRIDDARLLESLEQLAQIGMTEDGACCRLALTDEDRDGRDLVTAWMRGAGLEVHIDPIGNIFGVRAGREQIVLPRRIGWLSRALGLLPDTLHDRLLRAQPRKPRVGEAGATAIPGLSKEPPR